MEEQIMRYLMLRQNGEEEELRRDVLKKALNYVSYRFNWELYSLEEKMSNDRYRTSAHNAFMDAVNIYVRYMNQYHETQLDELGPDRQANGDLGYFSRGWVTHSP